MRYFLVLLFLVALFLPSVSHAVLCNGVENNLNLCYPEFGGIRLTLGSGLGAISWLYAAIIGLSGLAAFIMLVWAGFQWLSSAGNPSQVEDAKDKIRKALLGLLLVLSSFILVQFLNPELLSPSVPGLTAPVVENSGVPGQLAPGLYLCNKDSCSKDGELLRIDYFAPGCPSNIPDFASIPVACTPEFTTAQNWHDKAVAIRFDATLRSVALFENTNFGGRAICFNESNDRLDAIQLAVDTSLGFFLSFGDTGWAGDPDSMMILGPGQCRSPGITLQDKDDLGLFPQPPAVVFLFNEKEYGRRISDDTSQQRDFGLPLESWVYRNMDNRRSDEYVGTRNTDIHSVWVSPEARSCPPPGVSGISGGACAIRFYEDTPDDTFPIIYDTDAIFGADSAFDPTWANICFTEPYPDLTDFSFDCVGDNTIVDDLRSLEVIRATDCSPNQVVNCNGP